MRKGQKMTDAQRANLSKAKTGLKLKPFSEEHKMNISNGLKGHKHTEETRRRISESQMGRVSARKGVTLSEETKEKIRKARKHQIFTVETRRKLSESHRGEKSYLWRGGITQENKRIRNTIEYRLWRESVFKRDNYTCVWCGTRSGNGKSVKLNADHIKPFALYPELRLAIDNGRTLCEPCHKNTDTFAGRIRRMSA